MESAREFKKPQTSQVMGGGELGCGSSRVWGKRALCPATLAIRRQRELYRHMRGWSAAGSTVFHLMCHARSVENQKCLSVSFWEGVILFPKGNDG